MKRNIILAFILIIAMTAVSFAGCKSSDEAVETSIAEIERGDVIVGVTADGNLVMPHHVKLRFGTYGTVKEVMVEEGDQVKAGTLLAKIDDTVQKIAIESALYDMVIAQNELETQVCCQVLGYPLTFPNTTALLRFEQAQQEVEQALDLLEQKKYSEASAKIRIAQHDLEASQKLLKAPITDTEMYPDIASTLTYAEKDPAVLEYVQLYPNIPAAINDIEQDMEKLADAQRLIEQGNDLSASTILDTVQNHMAGTHSTVKKAIGQIQRFSISYPDVATSLYGLQPVTIALEKLQKLLESGDYDRVEFAEILREAQHDLEMSKEILENNTMVFEHGANLKNTAQYNLNIEKAEVALQKYKDELMKTEILAPFDGTVVDVGVKINDQLSSFDYSSITAVHLVDTKTVKVDGIVDEIDIFKVKIGQKAVITVDAMPQEEFTGTVTFISPFGTEETGVVNFAVTIQLDPTDIELKGGLTATADIVVDKRENVLLIPNRAIKGTSGNYWAEVILDEATGETERRQITLGLQNELYAEVISGLNEGDLVKIERTRTSTGGLFGG